MIDVEIPDEAFELVRSGKADAYASPRPPILEYAKQLPGSRVLDGHYGANIQAIAFNKGQAARLAYVSAFVEEAKASGLIQKAIYRRRRTRHRGVPAGQPDSDRHGPGRREALTRQRPRHAGDDVLEIGERIEPRLRRRGAASG